MNRNFSRILVLVVAATLAGAAAVWADTLELRDGRVIRGKYMGGTDVSIRMDVNGTERSFPISEVLALSFLESTGARMVPAESAPAAPAARRAETSDKVTVPAGTRILVRMIDGVDSERNHVGDKFRASLEQNLEADGVIVAPRGADVIGRLAEAKEAGHMTGHSELKLELTDIRVGDELLPIVTGDYDVQGKNRGGNTAAKTAGGAAIGAVIGALAGGGKGAAIGAGVGAGAGATINILTRGQQVRVPSETMLEFRLDQSFSARPAPAMNR
jgi:hypothetical protein